MSNGNSFARPRRARRRALIGLSVLVPAGVAGWLVWQSAAGGPGGATAGGGAPAGRPHGGVSPAPSAEPPGPAPAPSASGGNGAGSGSGGGAGDRDGPLAGKVVVIDPGHNPGNRDHPREIARTVDIGTQRKECDTTGTATGSGYAEAEFTLDVARRIRTLLEQRGAEVVLTQDGDRPYGPCIDERAEIGNEAGADAVVSVHADGAPAGARGFHVILPGRVREGRADTAPITKPSRELGERVASAYARETGFRPADYLGGGSGLDVRSDLGGLNLSTVPKVFVECGNMRNARDAEQFTSARWRGRAARGIADGVESFLTT
ncbi:N-acetylmuramoyl-L-alanine amidase [Streptomyces fradiae]|uniref:N-acetylmuramoyl-L-alanine amidase n=1 Tax=Streptomyces fradiae TaxID=1906 RepID=UPI000871EABC|nr:N-acetylmuramoyl-L-alanine amidase [Streptomyces fradiae]OFA55928.1 N-acetylmuramoyl-L-alanine amidase [Streptomyces fradiae]